MPFLDQKIGFKTLIYVTGIVFTGDICRGVSKMLSRGRLAFAGVQRSMQSP